MNTATRALARILLALVLLPAAALAEKTDILYLKNGDRITCEIKQLARGKLQVKTDGMGTIDVEWDDIARIESRETFVVELEDGSRTDGTVETTDRDGMLVLRETDGNTVDLPMDRVVWVDPLKVGQPRIKRWDGSVSAGFDATKANDSTTLTASFDARRRTAEALLTFAGSVYSQSQSNTEDTLRATLGTAYRHFLPDRWYWTTIGSLERNDELGLDLRTLGGGGVGRYLVQSGRSLWSVSGGLAVAHEQLSGDAGSGTDLEGLLNTDFEYFIYDTPKTTLTSALTVFPGLSDWGRVRVNLDIGLRHEIVEDLFFDLSFYDSFDSRAPDQDQNNDYGIVTSLGYSF